MEDKLDYFVVNTAAGYYAQSGFVADLEDAQAFCSSAAAQKTAEIVKGSVCSEFVLFEELERSSEQFYNEFQQLYSVEERQAITKLCIELQNI